MTDFTEFVKEMKKMFSAFEGGMKLLSTNGTLAFN